MAKRLASPTDSLEAVDEDSAEAVDEE